VFVAFGLVSVGIATLLLITVDDFKRMFAFSTVEHMGIIIVAAGLGGMEAHLGAAYQMAAHAIAKSFCFFAAGIAVMAVGTQEIASVRGLIRSSPLSASALLAGGFAIAGAPPFAVFVSEFVILKAALASGQYVAIGILAFFVVVAFCAVMYHINRMVFGLPDRDQPAVVMPASCKATLALAAVPLLLIGIYVPTPVQHLLQVAATAMGG
jgi:hydrogenase-4 component F